MVDNIGLRGNNEVSRAEQMKQGELMGDVKELIIY